jgi:hypothetical protein
LAKADAKHLENFAEMPIARVHHPIERSSLGNLAEMALVRVHHLTKIAHVAVALLLDRPPVGKICSSGIDAERPAKLL